MAFSDITNSFLLKNQLAFTKIEKQLSHSFISLLTLELYRENLTLLMMNEHLFKKHNRTKEWACISHHRRKIV